MARYTLKTFCGTKNLERFEHRSVDKLRTILNHPRHHKAGDINPFTDIPVNADWFEILDSHMEKIFQGNINDALIFIRGLK
jgi:hypothetical protein